MSKLTEMGVVQSSQAAHTHPLLNLHYHEDPAVQQINQVSNHGQSCQPGRQLRAEESCTPPNPIIEEALTEWIEETVVPEKGFR